MSEMIERVARAIWALQRDTDCNDYDKLWDGPGSAKEIARDMARAAIEAMRKMTPAMERANGRHNALQAAQWDNIISAALRDTG